MTDDDFTNQDFMLSVGDGHRLHVVDWGNPDAETPFVFLHGGPGGMVKDRHKIYFNPLKDRVIFFDQRGCGKSTPYGSLKNNTTEHLAADIIKIADHLKIEKFNFYGYSWGSTLALYTAINYPARVQNLVIGGVYSGSNDSPNMLNYLKTFFPEKYEQIITLTLPEHHKNLIAYYQDKALNGTPSEQKHACHTLGTIEFTIMNYDSDYAVPEPYEDFDPAPARIEAYYLQNHCFLPKDYLLNHASEITTPVYIIQGRSDLVCPPEYAYKLSQKLPHCHLYWANSNHYSTRELTSLIRTVISFL